MAYTAWSVVYGEQPTAAKWNQLGTNDAGFKDGTNIDNVSILERHLADGAVTTRKMKPTYSYNNGSTGGARQSLGTSYQAISGATRSYTSGATAEVLLIIGTCIANATAAGSQFGIGINGSLVGRTDYDDQASTFKGRLGVLIYEIAANTTVTVSLIGKSASGVTAIGNAAVDTANGYSPALSIVAFGR